VLDHIWLEYRFQHESFNRKAQPDFVLQSQAHPSISSSISCSGSCSEQPGQSTPISSAAGLVSFVCEVKNTWTDTREQLDLYVALLEKLGLETVPVTLCRNVTPQTPRDLIVRNFDELFPYAIMMVRV
jgi:hypothetical protein